MRASCLLLVGVVVTACTPKPNDESATPPRKEAPPDGASADPTPNGETASAPAGEALEVREVTLTASDGTKVFGDFYGVAQDKPRPIILLFHQAGSNAAEYTPIAPRLQRLGYNALAIDQRSGGERWEQKNRTVDAFGKSTSYLEAYPDLEAALAWAKGEGYPRVLVWGSSYSAALVFKLASEHPDEIHAVLSFSPGEYIRGDRGAVGQWASKVSAPIFVTSASGDEVGVAKKILDASPSGTKRQHEPTHGVHGSSTLRDDQNADGAAENWTAVEGFLHEVAP
jgi:dienelactone hydrolase